MTQEDKELLLQDLCARLSYGIYISPADCGKAILIGIKDGNPLLWDTILKKEYDKPWDIEYIKPYLRPMSSMTEEEKRQYIRFIAYSGNPNGSANFVDWLNAHHFDYRTTYDESKEKWVSMIEKGLALEAPEGMYK